MKQLKHHEIANIKTTFPIVVICDHFHSPTNVGMAFRVGEIMGIQHLYFIGDSPMPPNSKVKKTARAAEKNVPYTVSEDGKKLITDLKSEGYTIIGLEYTDQSRSLYDLKMTAFSKVALLFGSERYGISNNLLENLDYCFHIPMYGQLSSMNVVMAMSIGLYEVTKQWK